MSNTVQYSQTQTLTGDHITQLPVDQAPPTSNEIQIINTLFKKHRGAMDVVFEESKESIFVAILVILFSLPSVDVLIKRFLPISEKSPYIFVVIKGLMSMAIFWIIKHFYLSRKSL